MLTFEISESTVSLAALPSGGARCRKGCAGVSADPSCFIYNRAKRFPRQAKESTKVVLRRELQEPLSRHKSEA